MPFIIHLHYFTTSIFLLHYYFFHHSFHHVYSPFNHDLHFFILFQLVYISSCTYILSRSFHSFQPFPHMYTLLASAHAADRDLLSQ